MVDNNVIFPKHQKILLLVSVILTTLTMIMFLVSAVVLKSVVLTYIFMSLFFVSAIFEIVMCVFAIKYIYKKYVGKSNAF